MDTTVQDGMAVRLEYTLMADGAVVDSSEGREPFQYVHGSRQIIPGLERQLAGLAEGESRDITVEPEEGYGKADPQQFVEVSRSQLPPDVTPETGMMLRGTQPSGQPFMARIDQVKEESVRLDLNHPLAGKTLLFKVTVVDVSPSG